MKYMYNIVFDKSKNPQELTNGDFLVDWENIKYCLREKLNIKVYGDINACELSEEDSEIYFLTDKEIYSILIHTDDNKSFATIDVPHSSTDVPVNLKYIDIKRLA